MDFFKFFTEKQAPKDVAKERLKLILIHDRQDLSPTILEKMKNEILEVISKYVEIDNGDVDVKLTADNDMDGCGPALIANIPIKKLKE